MTRCTVIVQNFKCVHIVQAFNTIDISSNKSSHIWKLIREVKKSQVEKQRKSIEARYRILFSFQELTVESSNLFTFLENTASVVEL